MKLMRCRCDAGGTVSVQGPGFGRTFAAGAFVDFTEKVASDSPLTWGDVIGASYAHLFESVDTDVKTKKSSKPQGLPADVAPGTGE